MKFAVSENPLESMKALLLSAIVLRSALTKMIKKHGGDTLDSNDLKGIDLALDTIESWNETDLFD